MRFPRVALTSAAGESSGYQGFYVTESSNSANTARHSWKAFNMTFDNTTGDNAWANDQTTSTYSGSDYAYNGSINLGTGAVDGEWIKLQLPHKIRLEYMKIWLKDNDPTRIPEDWKLYGSDDNTNWTELFSKIGQGAILENTYNVNANFMYNYLAVVVTKISGQPDYFRILELEYYGIPEYDPEAHGVDVVVKSVPNVPNTDWLEVYYDGQDYSTMPATVTDKSGNDRTGTPSSGVSFDSTYKAFNFNGTTNGKIVGTHNLSGTSPTHTISIWFKRTVVGGSYDYVLTVGTSTTAQNSAIVINNNQIWFSMYGDEVISSITIVNDKWYHLTVTYNGGIWNSTNCKMYINGGLTSTTSVSYTHLRAHET